MSAGTGSRTRSLFGRDQNGLVLGFVAVSNVNKTQTLETIVKTLPHLQILLIVTWFLSWESFLSLFKLDNS